MTPLKESPSTDSPPTESRALTPNGVPKVVVAEFLHPAALELLAENCRLEYHPELFRRPGELRAALIDADGLVVRNQTMVTGALVAGTRLRVVGRVGVGLDNLELPALRAAGLTVTFTPGANAVSVAEYTLGAMVALARRFPEISPQVHSGQWNRQASIGFELAGKALGIIGLGDIGGKVARLGSALSMRLLATDPAVTPDAPLVRELGVEMLPQQELLSEADVVSLHVPLLESTRGLIDRQALAQMKQGAYLVNSARGGVVDEAALAEALLEGRLSGAALDVRETEPPARDDPLAGVRNVLLTPHIAGVTEESMVRACLRVVRDVLRVLGGQAPESEAPTQDASS